VVEPFPTITVVGILDAGDERPTGAQRFFVKFHGLCHLYIFIDTEELAISFREFLWVGGEDSELLAAERFFEIFWREGRVISRQHMNQAPQIPNTVTEVAPSSKDLMRFESEKKSAGVALFLCWLTGTFGGHRFYLGRPHAVTMLIITVVSLPLCFVIIGFFGLFAIWVWTIADLFQVSRWVREHNTALLAKIQAGHI
jgi:TM2 domain-containing membrane protein YozV